MTRTDLIGWLALLVATAAVLVQADNRTDWTHRTSTRLRRRLRAWWYRRQEPHD